ncbi:MAG: hypothetical protein ACK559_02670 [bacterium]
MDAPPVTRFAGAGLAMYSTPRLLALAMIERAGLPIRSASTAAESNVMGAAARIAASISGV